MARSCSTSCSVICATPASTSQFVRNITDVDDKIIGRAREIGIRPEQLARENIFTFWRDMRALNVASPDVEPRATEYIQRMIEFADGLVRSGHAYESGRAMSTFPWRRSRVTGSSRSRTWTI